MRHSYSDEISNSTVYIFGRKPPPLGGVSVHIERVAAKLERQGNHVIYFNTLTEWRYRVFFLYLAYLFFYLLFFSKKNSTWIYHTSYLKNAFLEMKVLVFLKKIKKIKLIVVEHNCRYILSLQENQVAAYQEILKCVDRQIFIGTQTKNNFVARGACAEKTSLEGAFLPPKPEGSRSCMSNYPKELALFMHNHYPIVLANASQMAYFKGADLYGFDQLILAFVQYQKKFCNAGLILMFSRKGDAELYNSLLILIEKYGLQKNVFILVGGYLLWPLLKYIDLFVRPAMSDGASVSVEEALYFNVPVVASDIGSRPKKCILYPVGNSQKLFMAMCDKRIKLKKCPIITKIVKK